MELAIGSLTATRLRHDDRGDPVERRLDWRQEALNICMRAVDNLFEVTGKQHPRVRELGYPVGNS